MIVCDDVLSEEHASSSGARRHLSDWFQGSLLGMPHGGMTRTVYRRRTKFAASSVALLGTPMSWADLLMSTRSNPVWQWYRFSAEYDDVMLPLPGESLAVEVGGSVEPGPSGIDHKARGMASTAGRHDDQASPFGCKVERPFGEPSDQDPEARDRQPRLPRAGLRWRL